MLKPQSIIVFEVNYAIPLIIGFSAPIVFEPLKLFQLFKLTEDSISKYAIIWSIGAKVWNNKVD